MNESMEEIVSNPINILIIISLLNNSFNDVYYDSQISLLRKLNISEKDIEEVIKEKEQIKKDPCTYYFKGHCVSFSNILCSIFEGYAVRYKLIDHVIVKIGNHFYDVLGLIDSEVKDGYIVSDDVSLDSMYNNLAPFEKDEVELLVEQKLIELGKEKLNEFLNNRKTK